MRLSINKKVELLSVSIILFLAVALSFHFIRQGSSAVSSELNERAAVILRGLTINCEYPILVGDRESIHRLVRIALAEKDVVFCRIDGPDGKPIIEAGSRTLGPTREFVAPVVTEKTGEQEQEGVVLGVPTGIKEEIAKIHLGISLSGLNKKVADMKRAAALFAVLAILVVSLANTFLLKFLLIGPITALVRGTARIAGGDLNHRVQVKSNDEIGALALSFNKMVEDLSKTLVSRNYMNNIIKSMTDTLLVTDPEGRIRTVNRATLNLLGYSEDELIGKPICVLFREDPLDSEQITAIKSGMGMGNVEKTYVSKDGRKIPMLFTSSVMRNENGEIEGNVCVAQNITERRKAEEALLRQAEALTHSNTQLEAANAELMLLDLAKSEFVSNVSHELRTPLTAVKAYAETLLQYGSISEEKRNSFVGIILKQAERLAVLVDDLLDLSKIEAGEIKLNLTLLDVETAIEDALQSVRPAAQKKDIEIQVSLSEEGSLSGTETSPTVGNQVLADENRFDQVLVNLLNNAVKFTEPGGRVWIGSRVVQDRTGGPAIGPGAHAPGGPRYLRITVADNGIGIPAEELGSIFDKFKQVEEKTRGKPTGTGLGLSISKHLVERMGGHLWVESKMGEGSSFHFTVPLAQSDSLVTAEEVTAGAGAQSRSESV
ncbi:MAG: ATP-binding protein [Candidatus Eisenbacteria bacterium]|nr:ATP-binding protein [Candidatus Eisenbacteria bacterium]